ncbi:MAG: 2-phospho-L-lactate guanylyltransferase [Rhodospirillaceae bacterium]|nr:MAG: 2-phospho-L-lactate guanylyltransferase [Rhodospirillaceae bacterium]
MTVAALVPFKDLAQAKSRLALVLSQDRRRSLACRMLDHVVNILLGVTDIGTVSILSPAAPESDAKTRWLLDHGRGLNPEIADAVGKLDASRVLIIHADLPQLDGEDIRALVTAARDHDVVIAPDKAGTGTNALLLDPKAGFPFAFGPGSFEAHRRIAAEHKWSLGIVRRPGLSLDIDDPADLAAAGLTE